MGIQKTLPFFAYALRTCLCVARKGKPFQKFLSWIAEIEPNIGFVANAQVVTNDARKDHLDHRAGFAVPVRLEEYKAMGVFRPDKLHVNNFVRLVRALEDVLFGKNELPRIANSFFGWQ